MGITEEGGKAISNTVEAMKSQPLAIALILINLLFIAFNIWFIHDIIEAATDTNKRRDSLMMQLIKDCTTPQEKKDGRTTEPGPTAG